MERLLTRRLPGWVALAVLTVVVVRFAAVTWAGVWNIRGDYYASMPGAYVERVNPTLWNSPDMQGAWGYHLDTYFHGPVQYLTLYPLAYLDTYAAIAALLLPVYAILLGVAFWVMHRTFSILAPRLRFSVPLFASTFLFFPLLQAYVQREFEVVAFLALSVALLALVRDRRGTSAALLAYVAWFKYVPLLFLGYLGLRRWFQAVVVFLVTSGVILGLTHVLFDLRLFTNNNVPVHAAQVLNLWDYRFWTNNTGILIGEGFCAGWFEGEGTLANIRHGLCTVGADLHGFPPNVAYLVICAAIALAYLHTQFRFERAGSLSKNTEAWRRAIEFSVVTAVCTCFFFNHYYYLIALVIPFNVLLARYLEARAYTRLALWGVAYVLVSAFLVPTSVLTRLTGTNMWAWYIDGGWFLYGELLLMGLLLLEYRSLAAHTSDV